MKIKTIKILFISLVLIINFFVILGVEITKAYTPPIGIPDPDFGINESHTMYVGQKFDFDGDSILEEWEEYKDAGNGPYTHYINKNHPLATDKNNIFWTADLPRLSIPVTLSAGSVVEIHGFLYTTIMAGKSQYIIDASGTVDKPIFFRGIGWVDNPTFGSEINTRGQYIIFENLNMKYVGFSFPYRQNGIYYDVHHTSVRNCNLFGEGINKGSASVISVRSNFEHPVNNIVIYNNEISKFWKYDALVENDYHGAGVGANVTNFRLLNNNIHHLGGDSIQVNYYADSPNVIPNHIYIGKNDMHSNYENAVDLKGCRDVIISQNKMHDFAYAPTVSHYDTKDHTERAWFLYNEIYNVTTSNANSVTGGSDEIYFIGNIIHNIQSASWTSLAFSSWSSKRLYILNNTVFNSDGGINFFGTDILARATIINNIFTNLNTEKYVSLTNTAYAEKALIYNNIFYYSSWVPNIYGNQHESLTINPLLVDEYNNNAHLQFKSPAINAGEGVLINQIYATFEDLYPGQSIRYDFDWNPRPINGPRTIWAYEYIDDYIPPIITNPRQSTAAQSSPSSISLAPTQSSTSAKSSPSSISLTPARTSTPIPSIKQLQTNNNVTESVNNIKTTNNSGTINNEMLKTKNYVKQLIISKWRLNKTNEWKMYINAIDLFVNKQNKEELLILLKKIWLLRDKLDLKTTLKYANVLDYLEASIWIKLKQI